MIWTDGSCLFFGERGRGVFAIGLLCGAEATLPISQAQQVQVFVLEPAPRCKLSAGLCSNNKSTASPLRVSLFPSCSFLLSHTFWQIWQELSVIPLSKVTQRGGDQSCQLLTSGSFGNFKTNRKTEKGKDSYLSIKWQNYSCLLCYRMTFAPTHNNFEPSAIKI